MSLTAESIRFLAGKGLTIEDIAQVAELNTAPALEQLNKVRSSNAERQARYRERRRETPSSRMQDADWLSLSGAILRRDKVCQYCGCADDLSVDHITPICQGGEDHPLNLVAACEGCNKSKGGRTISEWFGSGGRSDGVTIRYAGVTCGNSENVTNTVTGRNVVTLQSLPSLILNNSLENKKERKRASPKRDVTQSRICPEDWEPGDSVWAKAREVGFSDAQAKAEIQNMREYEFPRPYSKWDLVACRWLKRAAEFAARQQVSAKGRPVLAAVPTQSPEDIERRKRSDAARRARAMEAYG
jgi:DNA-binding transcriptional MerR regulator